MAGQSGTIRQPYGRADDAMGPGDTKAIRASGAGGSSGMGDGSGSVRDMSKQTAPSPGMSPGKRPSTGKLSA